MSNNSNMPKNGSKDMDPLQVPIHFLSKPEACEVQHPLDRGGDLLFLPVRVVMEPLTSFVSALINHGGAKGVGCEDVSLKKMKSILRTYKETLPTDP